MVGCGVILGGNVGDLDVLQTRLGLPASPLVRAGLSTAAQFFRTVILQDPMDWWGYLRGIDFHQPVSVKTLPKGTSLARFDSLGERSFKPFVYFTTPGTSPFRLGTSFPQAEFKLFEVGRPTSALESRASGLSFSPRDRVSRLGGGVQYIVAFRDAPSLVRTGVRGRA
jgi:hypothetical protein